MPDLAAIRTVRELADRLSAVATERDDRLAYFAALYALMTGRVAEGVEAGRFEDGPRMERLACHFAARYLSALHRFGRGEEAPECWAVAFEAADNWRPLILQHLMLGMNAHINFDLGIAAAEVAADGGDLAHVRADFLEINAVLEELLEDVQRRLARVSPWMGLIDTVGGRKDEVVVNFSMHRARDAAWAVAERLIGLEGEARAVAERDLDRWCAAFARVILKPGRAISTAALPARLRERASVAEVVAAFGVTR